LRPHPAARMDDLEIINQALIALGEPTLASGAAPSTKAQRLAAQRAGDVRRELLQKHRWTAATITEKIEAEIGVTPPAHQYQGVLPGDLLAVWDCSANNWTIAADRRFYWTGPAPAVLIYAADVASPRLDPLLIRAIGMRLAAQIVINIRDTAANAAAYERMAQAAEAEAVVRDALNRSAPPLLQSRWVDDAYDARSDVRW
jgi:hypothetical protein